MGDTKTRQARSPDHAAPMAGAAGAMQVGGFLPALRNLLLNGLLTGLLAGLSAGLLGGCLEADSLGDEPPDEVTVGDPPTWENGVGELMRLKCGVCHQVPRAAVSPDNVPQYFDLNQQFPPSSGVLGAVSIIPFIQAGILRMDLEFVPRMPLEQATPLTEAEKQALEAWDGT